MTDNLKTTPAYSEAIARVEAALRVRPQEEGGYTVDLLVTEEGGLGLTPSMSLAEANRWRWVFMETMKKVLS